MEHTGCVNICSLTSTLPVIPYRKLTDLHYISKGGFGTVFRAQHSDWRTTVAIKCLKLDSPVGERERNCLLKEAEVLHKARFNHIIQIFGVCNEPEFFCIVTEYMTNGSLDEILHEKEMYPMVAWPLRLRILYEIALGVNFLHNMTPPLLHHDLKTQNILMDGEYHAKIADFGLSKWRQLSITKGSSSKPAEMGGTVIYMPPEEYEPSKTRRADVKYDMYSYAIITWEVLSRRIPFEEATNPMQIMFSVLRGSRPDTGLDSLPADIPSRETLINLMTCGWTANPDERPSFLKCLIELEPMLRRFDEIDVLEAVLEVKRTKYMRPSSCCSSNQTIGKRIEEKSVKEQNVPWPDNSSTSGSGSCSSQEADISHPGFLTISNPSQGVSGAQAGPQPSLMSLPLDPPKPLMDHCFRNNLSTENQTAQPVSDLNIPFKPHASQSESDLALAIQPLTLQPHPQDFVTASDFQGPAARWIAARREDVVRQMTEACLNQSLDALLSRELLMREDYELVVNQPTRTAKVRKLLDTCERHSEEFCRVVVRKLQDNKQMGLQPYPDFSITSPPPPYTAPTAPFISNLFNTTRNF
ncbi:receptor-interacting serine/threonine-protein kinase 2 isoform X1 [Ctenopharyngodon idella]|uniref:receptor-interacting serine/threonine-protein kinase 2 isoform X1 n=2 Tax=Ctenopharyngodon idella TaxID=7959 RepID=UPI002230321E|nr:receptor-interacting serine/threonine-protein kinase 2 isoform X1 [Ctenopharyngodon idella]